MSSVKDDLEKLRKIERHVPLVNVSQADVIWLVASLQFYISRYQDLEKERIDEVYDQG